MSAFLDTIKFIVLLGVVFVLPGMAVLYSDWKHHKGWFE